MSHHPPVDTPVNQPGVDLSARPNTIPYVALVLGVLSVPGSLFTWDTSLPGKGFVWGLPVGLLAVVLGVVALRRGAGARWASITGVVLGGAMVAMIAVWTLTGAG